MLAQHVTACAAKGLTGRTNETGLCDPKTSGVKRQVRSALGRLTGTKVTRAQASGSKDESGTPSPAGLQALTLLHEFVQRTLEAGGKFQKWFMVMDWLTTLGKS